MDYMDRAIRRREKINIDTPIGLGLFADPSKQMKSKVRNLQNNKTRKRRKTYIPSIYSISFESNLRSSHFIRRLERECSWVGGLGLFADPRK